MNLPFSELEPVQPDRIRRELDTRSTLRSLIERQLHWAQSKGLRLQGSQGERGTPVYTLSLEANFFEPLSTEARREFDQGDGGELRGPVPKASALHSSAALCINTFHFWRRINRADLVAEALGFDPAGVTALHFERRLPIHSDFGTCPNLDAYLAGPKPVLIECKFSEPFGREHAGFPVKYLHKSFLWDTMLNLRKLAEQLCPEDRSFRLCYPKQLVCHLLAGVQAYGKAFALVYLFYDVPGPVGAEHRAEVADFARYCEADGLTFRAVSYQSLVNRLGATGQGPEWFRYMASRYL